MVDYDPSYFTNKYRLSQSSLRDMFEEGETSWNCVYKDLCLTGWTAYEFWLHVHPGIDLLFSDKEYELIGDDGENRIFVVNIETGECKYLTKPQYQKYFIDYEK
jgi:hypothetical protein